MGEYFLKNSGIKTLTAHEAFLISLLEVAPLNKKQRKFYERELKNLKKKK